MNEWQTDWMNKWMLELATSWSVSLNECLLKPVNFSKKKFFCFFLSLLYLLVTISFVLIRDDDRDHDRNDCDDCDDIAQIQSVMCGDVYVFVLQLN